MDGPGPKTTLGRDIDSKRKHAQRLRDIATAKHYGSLQGYGLNHAKACACLGGFLYKWLYVPNPISFSCNKIGTY